MPPGPVRRTSNRPGRRTASGNGDSNGRGPVASDFATTTTVDESPAIAAKYGIRNVPTVLVFEAGQKKAQQVGLCKRDKLVQLLGV